MSKSATVETTPGPVLLSTPEVQQAQHLLARQQIAVAMERARRAADTDIAQREGVLSR